MVAAWMSADTGVGPSMASSNQDCSGTWADLPHAPSSSSSPITVARVGSSCGMPSFDVDERRGAERGQHQHDRDRHAEIADPVDHEGLLGRDGRTVLVLPETDQQVRGQADTLPADEQHQIVVGEHQQQHRRHEQVQEGEEPAPTLVVRHVADGVDVDQTADAGDQQDEHDRQLVDQQADVDVPAAGGDPGVQRHADGPRRLLPAEQLDEQHQTEQERQRSAPRSRADAPTRHPPGRPATARARSAPGWRSAARPS